MSQAIIRGLWGHGRGHSDHDLERTILESKQNGDPVDKVYCFGIENKKMLERCGYKPDMLDPEPIASPRILKAFVGRKSLRWGVSYWWHKLKIIEAATQEFDHVLWQDFNVRLKKPLPSDFWEELKSGASFRASLVIQKSAKFGAWWRMSTKLRAHNKHTKQPPLTKISNMQQAQIVPIGKYFYVRGASMGQQLMALQSKRLRWNNQPLFALMIDQLYQGWPGIQSYVDNGHEMKGFFYGASIFRPKPRQTIWLGGNRKVQRHAKKTEQFWETW